MSNLIVAHQLQEKIEKHMYEYIIRGKINISLRLYMIN